MRFLVLSCFLIKFVEISVQFSYEIESKFLYQLDGGCKNMDIRFDARYLELLESCRTVHGYLRISELSISSDVAPFAELREITGYFLFTNVSGARSLSQLFPKLQVIRGEILHHGSALVITHARDLENIGLYSLTHIANGNVRVENNLKLSFVSTVDWKRLRKDLAVNAENNDDKETCKNSTHCWDSETSQELCENCDHCLISEASDDEKCTICNRFLFYNPSRSELKCTRYEPLTFELENRFLVSAEKCDEMGRTRLDDRCIRIDECPLDVQHYYNSTEQACLYTERVSRTCVISIKSVEDLLKFTDIDCNVALEFEIIALNDSSEYDVQKLLDEKLQNLGDIQKCLVIRDSPAIRSLGFLKRLTKISGFCENFSMLIANNTNLHTFIPHRSKISITQGMVIIRNNSNLCRDELTHAKLMFANTPNFDVQEDECKHGKLSIDVRVTEDSALIMTDAIARDDLKLVFKFINASESNVYEMANSYYEVTGLVRDTTYPFKIEINDPSGTQLYDSGFNFLKTSNRSSYIIEDIDRFYTELNIKLNPVDFLRDFKDDNFAYFVSYNATLPFSCDEFKDGILFESKLPFSRYFMQSPSSNFFESIGAVFPINSTYISIEDLSPLTCYKITISTCTSRKKLFCKSPSTVAFVRTDFSKIPIDHSPATDEDESEEHDKNHNRVSITPFSAFELDKDIEISTTTEKNRDISIYETPTRSNTMSLLITISAALIIVPIMFFYTYKIYSRRKNQNAPPVEQELRDNYEIKRENVVKTKFLGKGEFGVVYLGHILPNKDELYAIKTLSDSKENYEDSFIKEAQIMRRFDSHHVVKLIGYCIEDKPPMVIMELMAHGDLKKFLQRNRPSLAREAIVREASSSYSLAPTSVKPLHPIRPVAEMAMEIADGMMYLESIKFIHCDLACRNCMVHASYTIKIGDFGMARELYYSDYYKPGSRNKKIPLRWMSPEALGSDTILPRYTSKSDVFSFGVVLYELVTYCEKPYAAFTDDEVIQKIKKGETINRPEDCDEKIYRLMQNCWRYDPSERMSFKEIIEFLMSNFEVPSFSKVSFYHSQQQQQ